MYNILNNHKRRFLDKLNRNNGGRDETSCTSRRKRECFLVDHVTRGKSYTKHNNEGKEGLYWYFRWELETRTVKPKKKVSPIWDLETKPLYLISCNLKDLRLTPQKKWKIVRQTSTGNSFNGRCKLCLDEKLVQLISRIADNKFMNVTNLCLNIDIKLNLNYPDWGPTRLLHEMKTRILILDDF